MTVQMPNLAIQYSTAQGAHFQSQQYESLKQRARGENGA
jgi:hypothetical protein